MFPYIVYHCVLILLLMKIMLRFLKVYANQLEARLSKRHVVVTGGSSGIGKEVALLAAKSGAHVTVVARNVENLLGTVTELQAIAKDKSQVMKYVSVDCSDVESVAKLLLHLDDLMPVYMLVNCAGTAVAGKLEDLSAAEIKRMMEINVYGTIFPTKALAQRMKERQDGVIVLTGSMCSLFGLYGYTAYAASKFAVRGFAESLRMELGNHRISVTLAVPPDTETAGYENENKTKPPETVALSKMGDLYKPDVVASKLIYDALDRRFFSSVGVSGYFMTSLCAGLTPIGSLGEFILQTIFLGSMRAMGLCLMLIFYRIVKKFHLKRIKLEN